MKLSSLFLSRVCALASVAVLAACSGSSDNEPVQTSADSVAKSNWQLNGATYSSTARATATSESSELTIVGVGTDGADGVNGDQAGSSLLIAHSLTSPGEYRITDSLESFTAALKANPDDRVAHIAVTVGTAAYPTAATRYESAGVGKLSVVIDQNGDYHFSSAQPLTVNKITDLGTGVAQAPDSAQLVLNDIYDLQGAE